MRAFDRRGQGDVGLGEAADAGRHDIDGDLAGRQRVQRISQRLDAALHVGLDQKLHRSALFSPMVEKNVLHVGAFLAA